MIDRRAKPLCRALRESLQTGKRPALPAGGDLLWTWFSDLHAARSFGMNGPNPITFTEIAAYLALYRIPAQPHHIAILRAMDAVYLDFAYASRGSADGGGSRKPSDITAVAFDAFFG